MIRQQEQRLLLLEQLQNKIAKYTELNTTHHFTPIAIETGGAWNQLAIEFVSELGKKMTEVTKEPGETQFLFLRLSIALQRGNSVAFRNTFIAEQYFFFTTGMLFHEHLLI